MSGPNRRVRPGSRGAQDRRCRVRHAAVVDQAAQPAVALSDEGIGFEFDMPASISEYPAQSFGAPQLNPPSINSERDIAVSATSSVVNAATGQTYAIWLYPRDMETFRLDAETAQVVCGEVHLRCELTLLRLSTAYELQLPVYEVPPDNRHACQCPQGLVIPSMFVIVGIQTVGSLQRPRRTSLQVLAWNGGPDIYLGRRWVDSDMATSAGLLSSGNP